MNTSTGAYVAAIIFLAIPVTSKMVMVLARELDLTIKMTSLPYAGRACLMAAGNTIRLNKVQGDIPTARPASISPHVTDRIPPRIISAVYALVFNVSAEMAQK